MNWFEKIFGFRESKDNIQKYISHIGNKSFNSGNGDEYHKGNLLVLSLENLKSRLIGARLEEGQLSYKEIFGDIKDVHQMAKNVNIQVASQFNLLEMMSPSETKEDGITKYINDRTQGPICAMACPVGTLYRNYETDINTLDDVQYLLNNKYIQMVNGYALFNGIDDNFHKIVQEKRDDILNFLKIGIMENTEVLPHNSSNTVNQIYCSAIPLTYQRMATDKELEEFSKLILESLYESTYIYSIMSDNPVLYLTQVGCGAFGNDEEWVIDIVNKLNKKYKAYKLSVFMVRYKG